MQEGHDHHDVLHVLALNIESLLGDGREEPIECFSHKVHIYQLYLLTQGDNIRNWDQEVLADAII